MSKAAEILRALNSQIQHPLEQREEQTKHEERAKLSEPAREKETANIVENVAIQPKNEPIAKMK